MANAALHRDNLIRTAMRLFRTQGYASTGLQQILAESGAPKGSLYHYFPGGKEALAAEAVALAGRLVGELLADLADRHADPRRFVAAYCTTMAGWMRESGFRSGCPIATTMLETAPHVPAVTQAGVGAMAVWIGIAAGVFERSGAPPAAARRDAQLLIAAMEGALLLARMQESTAPILALARHRWGGGATADASPPTPRSRSARRPRQR
jgi:TetR/AcrR family transcriptional repressor of lmrAB and yxaGH operons